MKTLTRETYSKRIERVLDYLSLHIDEALDTHRLAEEAFLSPYHFHRVYVAMMGETLAETIRRKRLHWAAVMLISADSAIAKIAMRAGYSSVAAFTRSFADAYGIPPAKYRLHRQLHQQLSSASGLLQHSPTHDRKERSMFNLNDVHVKTLPEVRVAALTHHGDYQTIGDSFQRLGAWAAGKGFFTATTKSFGIYYDDPMSKPKPELRSEACIEAPGSVTGDNAVRILQTPGGKCAVFEFTGPYSDLEAPYRWLYDTWLPQSNNEPRDAPPYEEYLNDARSTPPAQLKTAICIPLK
jgi:AraC family transcriptional regulator